MQTPSTSQVPVRTPVAVAEREALELAATMSVGRLALGHDNELVVIPVNFLLDARDVLFRTAEGSGLLAAARQNVPAVLEVDDLVNWSRSGWSVLIRGRLTEVTDPDQVQQVLSSELSPWAGGERDHVLRLVTVQITGRRIEPGPGALTVLHL